jgi:hypothetical protein
MSRAQYDPDHQNGGLASLSSGRSKMQNDIDDLIEAVKTIADTDFDPADTFGANNIAKRPSRSPMKGFYRPGERGEYGAPFEVTPATCPRYNGQPSGRAPSNEEKRGAWQLQEEYLAGRLGKNDEENSRLWNTERAVVALRDRALDLGGKIIPASESPLAGPVSRDEFDAALKEFSRFVSGAKRMTFWRKDDAGKRAWVQRPEAHAQNLLHTYMHAKFGERVEIFEELDTGAGRLDLYIKLSGGLSIVLELKMCGAGYSSDYAASGETQLVHYMDNRKTHLGYLVVFDARMVKRGQILLPGVNGSHTLVETLIDMRPEVK